MSGGPVPAGRRAPAAENGEGPARGVFRFREHTLRPDRRPEAVPVTFTMYCGMCGAMGPTAEAGGNGTAWAVEHLKDNPAHLDYRELITRPYRFEPGAWL